MAETLDNAFAQQPTNLASPVPVDDDIQALNSALESAPPAQPVSTSPISEAESLNQAFASAAPEVAPDIIEPDRGFLSQNLTPGGIAEQFENFEARVRGSFGRTDKEKLGILKNFLGEQNAKMRADGNGFMIKPKGRDKFIKLEPDSIEIIGDMFIDGFRDMISAGAGTGAVALQGPAALEPVSSALAFGVGVAAGDALADSIVENLFGTPRDPSRGGVAGPDAGFGEQLQAGGERALGNITTGLTATVFNEGTKKLLRAVGDRRGAMKALKELKDTPKSETLKQSIDINLRTMDDLVAMDKVMNLPGSDMPILAHQIAPHTDAGKLAKSLTGNPTFIKAQDLAAKNMDESIINMLEESAELVPGSLRKVLSEGTKPGKPGIQKQVSGLFKSVRQAEGKLIEQFRAKASKEAASQPIRTANTAGALKELVNDLGIQPGPNGGLVFPDDASMAQLLGTDSKLLIKGFKNDINRLFTNADSATIDNVLGQARLVGAKNSAASRVGGKYKFYIGKLSSALRADAREAMPNLLNEADASAFQQAIGKFQQAAVGQEVLKNMLKQDDMATNVFAKGLINKGRAGLGQFKAAKEFLLENDPELWGKVSSEFFEEVVLKHRNVNPNAPLSFNSKALRKELAGYGSEMLDELMPGKTNAKTVFKALDLSEQLEQTIIKGTDDDVEQVTKSLFGAASQFISAKLNAAYALGKFGTNNSRLLKLMHREGVDKFLEKVPVKDQGAWKSMLESQIGIAVKRGIIKTAKTARDIQVPTQSVGIGSDVQQIGRP